MKQFVEITEAYDENDPDCPFVVLGNPDILLEHTKAVPCDIIADYFDCLITMAPHQFDVANRLMHRPEHPKSEQNTGATPRSPTTPNTTFQTN